MSIEDWFFHMDGQTCANNHSDGRVTTRELQKGLKLCPTRSPDSELRFNPKDVQKLVRFMDPNADGDLSLEECSLAVEKLEQGELRPLHRNLPAYRDAHEGGEDRVPEVLRGAGPQRRWQPVDTRAARRPMAITEARESEKAAVSAAQGWSDPLTDAFRAWHTCFATCTFDPVSNEGLLKVFALQLEFYATNTGKTGTALKVVLPRPSSS